MGGGGGGIRTRETLPRLPVFETGVHRLDKSRLCSRFLAGSGLRAIVARLFAMSMWQLWQCLKRAARAQLVVSDR